MEVDAVFFDVGNTLIYPEPPVGEVYAEALREAGIPCEAPEVERQFEAAWQRLRAERDPATLEYGTTEAEALSWWRQVVAESFRPFGRPEDFESLFRRLWEHFASGMGWSIYEDVPETLAELRRREIGIGLISNWDIRLEKVLRDLGLWERFDWPVVSAAVGAEKPDPAIFRHALGRCAVPAERALHVGDSYEEDFLGARKAGLRAVLIRRDGAGTEGAEVVSSLSEVLELLDSRSG